MKNFLLGVAMLCALPGPMAAGQSVQEIVGPETVRPIEPAGVVLPTEAESAGITRFSFLAYGDTRGQVEGQEEQPAHAKVIEAGTNASSSRRRRMM